jgi:SPP1 family predicted phage head-tail adaptor
MRAGLLRETITIQQPVIEKDEYGSGNNSWKDLIRTRAQVTYKSGDKINQNNEIINTNNIIFTIRSYHQINDTYRILYKGKKYRILFIKMESYNKQSITITAEIINE